MLVHDQRLLHLPTWRVEFARLNHLSVLVDVFKVLELLVDQVDLHRLCCYGDQHQEAKDAQGYHEVHLGIVWSVKQSRLDVQL